MAVILQVFFVNTFIPMIMQIGIEHPDDEDAVSPSPPKNH